MANIQFFLNLILVYNAMKIKINMTNILSCNHRQIITFSISCEIVFFLILWMALLIQDHYKPAIFIILNNVFILFSTSHNYLWSAKRSFLVSSLSFFVIKFWIIFLLLFTTLWKIYVLRYIKLSTYSSDTLITILYQ